MALFNKEPEKNLRPDAPVKPQSVPAQAGRGPPRPPFPAGGVSPPRQASTPLEARAYLDQGSKVSGKLSFEGPARVDGQGEGEITPKQRGMGGEGPCARGQIKP